MAVPERWRGFPRLPTDIEERVEVLGTFFEKAEVRLAYVFGSVARGEAADDLDLAILTDGRRATELRGEITELLGTERVDVVDLAFASPTLRFRVASEGELVYASDEDTERSFVLGAVREYRDTHHHRRIQDEYLERWANA